MKKAKLCLVIAILSSVALLAGACAMEPTPASDQAARAVPPLRLSRTMDLPMRRGFIMLLIPIRQAIVTWSDMS